MEFVFGGKYMWNYKFLNKDGDESEGVAFADDLVTAVREILSSGDDVIDELLAVVRGDETDTAELAKEIREAVLAQVEANEGTKH